MNYLKADTPVSVILSGNTEELRFLVHNLSKDLTPIKAAEAPKVFQLKKTIGETMLVKIVCVLLKAFCESINAKRSMDNVEILECAEELLSKYTHDSIKDFVLALKLAKQSGKKFYENVNSASIMEIISGYMESKAAALETEHLDMISKVDGSIRTEMHTLGIQEENRQKRLSAFNEEKELGAIRKEADRMESIKKDISDLLGDGK